MKQRFEFEFEEEKQNRITFEYSPEADEKLDTQVENNVPILSLNRPAMITLAKTLIKMALGPYDNGFHVHLRKDLNADLPDRLIVMLYQGENAEPGPKDRPEVVSNDYIGQ
jgi:hypothetical protein